MKLPTRLTTPEHLCLGELCALAGLSLEGQGADSGVTITALTDDSRAVGPGSLFVAVRGKAYDGHLFIDAAINAGAAAVVVEGAAAVADGVPGVRVSDTREALAKLAAAYYRVGGSGVESPRCIGITGTNGKTTVAWLLRSILQTAGRPTAVMGTIEYDLLAERLPAPLTTPGPIDLCRHVAKAGDAGAAFVVLEVSSHALDQRRVDGLKLAAGVFTNLSGDHLDYHGTMESYKNAKRRLFEGLDQDATAVVNRDDPASKELSEGTRAAIVTYGLESAAADVTARVEGADMRGSRFRLRGRTFEANVRLGIVGRYNITNALAAAATAEALGVPGDVICAGLEGAGGVPGRLQSVAPVSHPFTVLVDYAHTDDALGSVLRAVRPLTRGRLICVFGCGGDRDRRKRPRMAAAVGAVADIAYVTSDNPRTEKPEAIIDEILPGFSSLRHPGVRVEVDRRRAIQSAIAEARPGDTVLIAGKGHETYQLVGDRVLDFDDVDVARECLEAAMPAEEVA